MRTRYHYGNLQLDKRSKGPSVWIFRWREYLPHGKVRRRGEMIGTTEQNPTKAAAQKASQHLLLNANGDNLSSRNMTFGMLLDRYQKEELPDRFYVFGVSFVH